jgi:hypothetical protein
MMPKKKRGYSPFVVALTEMLKSKPPVLARFPLHDLNVEIVEGAQSIWAIIRRTGQGGIALRAAFLPAGIKSLKVRPASAAACEIITDSAMGHHQIVFAITDCEWPRLHLTVRFNPAVDTVIPFLPRDLYPLDANDTPFKPVGTVEAAQRGLNSGVLYFHIDRPSFGSVLYFQNLTSMNDYYIATETKPDAAVGGEWPELGYLPPTPPQIGIPPVDPLPAGKEVILSDATLVFGDISRNDERQSARAFLQMLGAAYSDLSLPLTDFRDWPGRARKTLHDLEKSPKATIEHYGHRYIRPYTDAEYPDSMVQMMVLSAVCDWSKFSGKPHKLEPVLRNGMGRFYDKKLGTIRRYLPNVGKDKDANAVDSWYLYHPLLNLARVALEGDNYCKRLFVNSLDYAVRAARHFNYIWPIQYCVDDLSVLVEARDDKGLGQTDVGGIYAYVMLQAHQLTGDERYLDEAKLAIDAAKGMRFELQYQANLTAWGAAACIRLWRLTRVERYLHQSYVYLASFFHNCEIWESDIGHAKHYSNFLGVTCLHDAPYMAIYECYDSYIAFERYLEDAGPDLDPAARLLISEYCKYALDRAWFYYPDALPAEALATDIRNGHIDRKLSFPLEDLYPDGQPAGQVGQEIYGAGAAMAFAARSFHNVKGAPFTLFCDHFIRARDRIDANRLSIQLDGGENCNARLSILARRGGQLPKTNIECIGGCDAQAAERMKQRQDYTVPAQGRIILSW